MSPGETGSNRRPDEGRMPDRIRILHLEDNDGDAILVRSFLESEGLDHEILRVHTRDAFLAALEQGGFDLILSDYALPSFDGISALLLARERNPDLPFILVSGTMGEELAIETLKSGATDYVLKERISRLGSSVRRALEEARERREGRSAQERQKLLISVTEILAESVSVEEVLPRILRAVCEQARWEIGEFWRTDREAGVHRWAAGWHLPLPGLEEFLEASREVQFAPGEGLPGRAWASRKAEWIGDLGSTLSFGRAAVAARHGLRTAFAAPVRSGDEVHGVLAFLRRDPAPPSPALLEVMNDIGGRLGLFLDRKRAAQGLRDSEEKYRSIVETTNEWIWARNLDGRLTYSNPATEAILGYPPEELVGKDALLHLHPEDHSKVQELLAESFAKKQGWNGVVLRWRHRDGSYRSLESNAAPILDEKGELTGYRGADRDITERVNLEAQLRQSQKMEAVGTLAGGVAHDFNNLLTTILGYSEFLLGNIPEGNALREDVEEIKKAGERAASLTRQLLAFSRKQVLKPVVFNLNTVVTDLERMLRRIIGEDIELVAVTGSEVGFVRADPGQMEQVIVNLAANARDAMPRGGKLTIETGNCDLDEEYVRQHSYVRPGAYVCLAVSDTGTGMDPQTKARIFEPFFTTKPAGRGTGLGLSMVYGILKQSGGSIEVYSEPGRGTSFKVLLPRISAAGEREVMSEVPRAAGGSETILLVEDEAAVRGLARRVLVANGYTVLEAASAEEALGVTDNYSGRIHLLLSDAVMPGASGPEMARQITVARPDTRVLFISGYTDDAIVRNGLLKPTEAFLQKPFGPEALARKVREVLDAPSRFWRSS